MIVSKSDGNLTLTHNEIMDKGHSLEDFLKYLQCKVKSLYALENSNRWDNVTYSRNFTDRPKF